MLSRESIYLGPWPEGVADPPPEVQRNYDREVSEWLARGRRPRKRASQEKAGEAGEKGTRQTHTLDDQAEANETPGGLTVAELVLRFLGHAEEHYRKRDGARTYELGNVRIALRPLVHAYGRTAAADFGPLKLKAVRSLLVLGYDHPKHGPQPGLVRNQVNARVRRIIRAFRWAVGEELVPVEVWQALKAVPGLEAGRSAVKESDPVAPVPVEDVEATLPHLLPETAAMVRVQLHSGMRPGEVCALQAEEIDQAGPVWVSSPPHHKNTHRGKARTIPLGPRAQEVLRPFLRVTCPTCQRSDRAGRLAWIWSAGLCERCSAEADRRGVCGPWPAVAVAGDYRVFSPAEAMADRERERAAKRKSKRQPSQALGRRAKPGARRKPRDHYSTSAYQLAIYRACRKAKVSPWFANQLRHTHGTEVRKRFGLEAAQAALGHSKADVTQLYAERDLALAIRVAAAIG